MYSFPSSSLSLSLLSTATSPPLFLLHSITVSQNLIFVSLLLSVSLLLCSSLCLSLSLSLPLCLRLCLVEMLDYITMCQLTILYSFRLRLVSHLYSVDSPVCFFSSSIIIGFLISDFIRLCALSRLRRCHFRSDFRSRSRTHHWSPSRCGTDGLNFSPPAHPPSG